jgi:predicted nucleotidyltransferase
MPPVSPDDIVVALRAVEPELRREYGVASLWLYGPAAATGGPPPVEANLMVVLSVPPEVMRLLALRRRLEHALDGLRVELVLRPADIPQFAGEPFEALPIF